MGRFDRAGRRPAGGADEAPGFRLPMPVLAMVYFLLLSTE